MTTDDSTSGSGEAKTDKVFTCGDTRKILESQMSKVNNDRIKDRGDSTMTAEEKPAAEINYSKWYDLTTAHAFDHSWRSDVSVAVPDFHNMS